MRITYSSLLYPTVNVKITNETDDNNEYYNKFMHYWESLYKNKKHFHFFMDLKSLTRPNLGLCIDFINRQKKLKESPIQYLDYSIVVVDNVIVKNILNVIWRICPPLNTVYLEGETVLATALLSKLNDEMLSIQYVDAYLEIFNITKI